MATDKLPSLTRLLFAGFLTSSKGVKGSKTDFTLTQINDNIKIDMENVKKYNAYFNLNDTFPLTYLYLLAFPSQISLMTNKKFPITVMGLVHLGNTMELKAEIDTSKPLKLETSALIPAKEEGSLFPVFKVNFVQDGTVVATCTSNYIAKRKRKGEKKGGKKVEPEAEKRTAAHTQEMSFTKKSIFQYAKISGDFNPIHISAFLAKSFGFKSSIAHGWCSASQVLSIAEKHKGKKLKYITVDWKTPILLPGKVKVELFDNEDGTTDFLVTNAKGETCLDGSVS